ncbi:MAG: preprotein translocase subunit SecE [Chitinophagales bacterium]|nr:preprotein translocase subunit SecE [Chitinophagales bacterium]
MDKLITYIKASYEELLRKVTWPTLKELQSHTIIVFIASAIIALMILLMDKTSILILEKLIYNIVG